MLAEVEGWATEFEQLCERIGARFARTYASPKRTGMVDRELYLPKEWAADAARRADAHVPEQVAFHTKPQLAQTMLGRSWTRACRPGG